MAPQSGSRSRPVSLRRKEPWYDPVLTVVLSPPGVILLGLFALWLIGTLIGGDDTDSPPGWCSDQVAMESGQCEPDYDVGVYR